jgi:N4-gp56 family major capsid protein
MLVVGDGSFTTIGFQTDGKTVKFQTKHTKPSENHTTQDPYGEMGFHSIKWWYGFMVLRPERIALVKTIAEWA